MSPRETGSSLRWDLQSKDTHLGHLMKNEMEILERYEKEKRYAQIYSEFERRKQADRDYKERFR